MAWTVCKVILLLLGAAALLCALVAFYLFLYTFTGLSVPLFRPCRRKSGPYKFQDEIDRGMQWLEAQNPRELTLQSRDGLRLRGHFLPGAGEVKRVLVCVHGFHSSGFHDFGCVAPFYHAIGCNLLILDQRAHAGSGGKFLTFGAKERFDVRDWAQYAASMEENRGLPLYLDGVSMGCTTVLLAGALDLPATARGIIADCGFTNPWDILRHVEKRWFGLPPFPLLYLTDLYCRCLAGFRLRDPEVDTRTALRQIRLPVFFLHGAKDNFVPTQMGIRNFEAAREGAAARGAEQGAAPCTTLRIVEGAGHAESYLVDRAGCEDAIRLFFTENDAWEENDARE